MDEMKNQKLKAGLRIKQIASAYPGYSFSYLSDHVQNFADDKQTLQYEAVAWFGPEIIVCKSPDLEKLYEDFSLKLHLHFKVIPSNQAA